MPTTKKVVQTHEHSHYMIYSTVSFASSEDGARLRGSSVLRGELASLQRRGKLERRHRTALQPG